MKTISIDQLRKITNEISNQDLKSKEWGRLGNWYSTSKTTPEKGSIFIPIVDGAIVTFKNKYGRELTGIIAQLEYDKTYKSYSVMIRTTNVNEIGGEIYTSNHGLSVKAVSKLLKSPLQIPQISL